MKIENGILSLSGADSFLTEDAEDAFKVLSGVALVYVVRFENGRPGRRSLVFEAHAGDTIPALSFRDGLYRNWRFCFSALGSAELRVIAGGCTSVLKKRFAASAGVEHFEREGFENGFADLYERNTVAEDAYLHKTMHDKEQAVGRNLSLIRRSFIRGEQPELASGSEDPLYRAAEAACRRCGIAIAPPEVLAECCSREYTLEDIARVSHFACRRIILEENWFHRDGGAIIVFNDKKEPLVCLPRKSRSYDIWNAATGETRRLTAAAAGNMAPEGVVFCRPFPEKMGMKQLAGFCLAAVQTRDAARLLVMALVSALIGILLPTLEQTVFDEIVPLGDVPVLVQLCALIGSFMLAGVLFSVVKQLASFRIVSRIRYECQNAAYHRLFSLPEAFLRKYPSADLAQRAMSLGEAAGNVAEAAISAVVVLTSMAVYFAKMNSISPLMASAALLMTAVYALISVLISRRSLRHSFRAAELGGEAASRICQTISGISKIRIAGVEERALHEYLKPFSEQRRASRRSENLELAAQVLAGAAMPLMTAVVYFMMIKGGGMTSGGFMGFTAAFGAFSAGAVQLCGCISEVLSTKPVFDRVRPILQCAPELSVGSGMPGELTGGIELNNVSFRYSDGMPNVINELSLNIRPGEYVGIVGASGCGKSTLLKLLLGFESPDTGKIYYDGKDIESLDKRELRKKFGVVLQDGRLISGSIFENITITAPKANLKDVERVVEAVGLREDVESMPMGLQTILSEDCGTISGGQQQRILIARALISSPAILFLDEATSALDNITQSMVCEALDRLDATRIVVAHRLSTVMKCDRIIVLDGGRIAEQGSCQELMEKNGIFRRLAERQM